MNNQFFLYQGIPYTICSYVFSAGLRGLPQWVAWEKRNAPSIRDRGGMVGKTTRVTKDGISKAVNLFCGYVVVEAETAEAAARLFQDHPHITVFPGDGVDIMPFLT